MRVLHVSPTDIVGGAPRGAYGLHRALRSVGADSLMLVQRKYSDDPTVLTDGGLFVVARGALRDKLDRLPLRLYRWTRDNWWTVGWLPWRIGPAIERIGPDVVHFHWIGRGAAPIEGMAELQRYPVFWTLRDMWPLTGGCHYSGGCMKFQTGCGACPQLGSRDSADISRRQWRRKQRHWAGIRITYVALSQWMARCARSSPLTFGNEICVIPSGIDVERFRPTDRSTARSMWGLPQDRRVILFGALKSSTDPRKGLPYLIEALQRLAANGWGERAICVVFGADYSHLDLGLELRSVGGIDDDLNLARLYAAADVMVVPSIEENLGKTAIEAMACGTPVVAFANTGQFDIIDHQVNGYLAANLSVADLADGIAWCIENGEREDRLSREARTKVLRCFDVREIARRHIALYETALEGSRASIRAAVTRPAPVEVGAYSSERFGT